MEGIMTNAKSAGRVTAGTQTQNPLQALLGFGQSVWLDYIRRDLISTGELARLIREDGLRGMTSNPSIFEKAIAGSNDYAAALQELARRRDLDATGIYEYLAIRDVQDAADVLRPVYDETRRRDGYVSLEVSPYLAYKTQETIDEARRLWKVVGRDNIMIKVPGTPAGIPAFRQLIAEGLNINVTASVASFFVSRIDTLVDSQLDARTKNAKSDADRAFALGLQGKAAIANAKLTYQRYKEIFSGPRWQALAARGAQTQRVLWASTSTKNSAYSDVLYVDELIGPDTVNTIPPATFDAFRDHGRPRPSLEENIDAARQVMRDLSRAGVSMKQVTDQLTADGVKLFAEAFDKLLAAVAKSSKKAAPSA
jgi:transaldolase/glucose-6-phosphate isomerase